MTDVLMQVGLSNGALAFGLAIAWARIMPSVNSAIARSKASRRRTPSSARIVQHKPSAIHINRLAGDITRLVRTQEPDDLGHFPRRADPP